MTQAITVNFHAYSGGGIEVRHEGECTWENCGQFMFEILKQEQPDRSKQIIDAAIDDAQSAPQQSNSGVCPLCDDFLTPHAHIQLGTRWGTP